MLIFTYYILVHLCKVVSQKNWAPYIHPPDVILHLVIDNQSLFLVTELLFRTLKVFCWPVFLPKLSGYVLLPHCSLTIANGGAVMYIV
jgi:hypothetical protein